MLKWRKSRDVSFLRRNWPIQGKFFCGCFVDFECSVGPLNYGISLIQEAIELHNRRGETTIVEPRQGSWDTRDLQFLKGVTINNWVILNTARVDDRQLQQFVNGLCKSAHFNGVKMSKSQSILHTRGSADIESKVKSKSEFTFTLLSR